MLLEINWYLFAGIVIIITLLVIYISAYLINKKMPVPKGCEEVVRERAKCSACSNYGCEFHIESSAEADTIKKETKEE